MRSVAALVLAIVPLRGVEKFLRVVSDAVLEHELHVLDVVDASGRVALHDEEIRILAHGDRPNLILAAEECGTVERRDANGLERREALFGQQLDLAMIAESGNDSGDA